RLLGPGDLLGEGSLRPERCWLASARAVTNGAMHVLPAAQLPRFAQYFPKLMAHIVTLLSSRLERAHRRLDLITAKSARERVLGLLYVMSEFHGREEGGAFWMPIRLSQAALGELVGLARESVGRDFSDLEEQGFVRCAG